MTTNYNELPEVNNYIKENNLTPCETERLFDSCYNKSDGVTYLVIDKDNTYISYSNIFIALRDANAYGALLVICRGEIKCQM